jgi:hypothetical protein
LIVIQVVKKFPASVKHLDLDFSGITTGVCTEFAGSLLHSFACELIEWVLGVLSPGVKWLARGADP